MTVDKFKQQQAVLQSMMQPKVTYVTKQLYYQILMDEKHPLNKCLKHEWKQGQGDVYSIIH